MMKELRTKDEAEYHGKYFNFPPVKSYPKPAQQPHPPIIIGGMARNVLRRIVSHADGWLPNRVTPPRWEDSRRPSRRHGSRGGPGSQVHHHQRVRPGPRTAMSYSRTSTLEPTGSWCGPTT